MAVHSAHEGHKFLGDHCHIPHELTAFCVSMVCTTLEVSNRCFDGGQAARDLFEGGGSAFDAGQTG